MSKSRFERPNKGLPSDEFIYEVGEKVLLIVRIISRSLQKQKRHLDKSQYKIDKIGSSEKLNLKKKYEQEKERIINEWEGF